MAIADIRNAYLSFGRTDSKLFCLQLNQRLLEAGLTTWIDPNTVSEHDTVLEVDDSEEIGAHIDASQNFIAILSPDWVNSPDCQKDLEWAVQRHKRIIPLLHLELIDRQAWQQAHPDGTDVEWEAYQAQGSHTSLLNLHPAIASLTPLLFRQQDDFEASFGELLALLDRHKEYVQKHTYFLIKALQWQHHHRNPQDLLNSGEQRDADAWLATQFQNHAPCTPTELHDEFIRAGAQQAEAEVFYDAFISYGRPDSLDFCRDLHQKLRQQGFNIWFDKDKQDLPPAVDYQKQIDAAIARTHNFLFVISPHSVNSVYCRKEIEQAARYNKRIIPIWHVSEISYDTWKQRYPTKTEADWAAYQAKGEHLGNNLNPNMHPLIAKTNWLPFQPGKDDPEAALQNLIEAIARDADYVQQHTRLLAKALEWERNQKRREFLLIGETRIKAGEWLQKKFKEQPPCEPNDLHCEYICESIENANNLMTQVFLCHAEADQAIATQLSKVLMRAAITLWTRERDVQSGETLEEAVRRGIEETDNILYLLSPDAVRSPQCQTELAYARSLNKRIIPFKVKPVDSDESLAELQGIIDGTLYAEYAGYADETCYKQSTDRLLQCIYDDAPYYTQHKILLTKALKWDRQKRNNLSLLLRGHNLHRAQGWWELAKGRSSHPPTHLHDDFIAASLAQPPDTTPEVFISYSRVDSDFARRLNDTLQNQGKTTWFDQESIASAEDFQTEIYRGVENSANFLLIISPAAVKSPYCVGEVEHAVHLNKRMITVLHQPVEPAALPEAVKGLQWIDFNDNGGDFNTNFSELVRTLDTDRDHVQNHTKWAQRSREWADNQRSRDLLLRGSELAVAEAWLNDAIINPKKPPITPLQQDYIQASKAESQTELRKQKRQNTILKVALVGVSGLATIAVIMGIWAIDQQRKAIRSEIEALTSSANASFTIGEQVEALRYGLRAADRWQNATWLQHDNPVRSRLMTALQRPLYRIRARNVLEGHNAPISAIAFSGNGELIAAGSDDGTVKLWGSNGSEIATLTPQSDESSDFPITLSLASVASTSEQPMILTAGSDSKARLWNADGHLINTLEDIAQPFYAVALSPDGQAIATLSTPTFDSANNWVGETIKIWQPDGTLTKTLGIHAGASAIAYSPDGQRLVTTDGYGTAQVWLMDGSDPKTLSGHAGSILDVAFSNDGQLIATASSDGTVKLWRVDGNLIKTLEGHTDFVRSVAFSPDSQMLVSAGDDRTIILWGRDGSKQLTFPKHSDAIMDVQFSPDGQVLASASNDNTVKLWRTDGSLIETLRGHSDNVSRIQFSPDGTVLASAGVDRTIRLWNPTNLFLTNFSIVTGSNGNVMSGVYLSPSKDYFVTVAKDDVVKVWSISGQQIATLPLASGEADPQVFFSPDGKTLVTTAGDNTTQLWNSDGSLIQTLVGVKNPYVSFSSDSQFILTQTVRDDQDNFNPFYQLWHSDGTLVTQFDNARSVMFLPDSDDLLIIEATGKTLLWQTGQAIKPLFDPAQTPHTPEFTFTPPLFASDDETYPLNSQLYDSNGTPLPISFIDRGRLMLSATNSTVQLLNPLTGEAIATLINNVPSGSQVTGLISQDSKTIVIYYTSESRVSPITTWYITAPDNITSENMAPDPANPLATPQVTPVAVPIPGLQLASEQTLDVSLSPDGAIITTTLTGITNNFGIPEVKLWRSHDGTPLTAVNEMLSQTPPQTSVKIIFPQPSETASTVFVTIDSTGLVKLWNHQGETIATLIEANPLIPIPTPTLPPLPSIPILSDLQPAPTIDLEAIPEVYFSPNGQTIAVLDTDTTQLWRTDGTPITTLSRYKNDAGFDPTKAFSPDGQFFALVNLKSVMLQKLDDDSPPITYNHSGDVRQMGFSADGRLFASIAKDGVIKLWERDNGGIFDLPGQRGDRFFLTFDPNNQALLSVSADETISVGYDLHTEFVSYQLDKMLDLDNLIHRSCELIGDYLTTNSQVEEVDRNLCPY